MCQDSFKKLGEDGGDASDMECICIPGVTLPCIAGRAHRTLAEDRDAFLTRFRGIHDARDADGANRLGRCPFKDCNRKMFTMNNLGDCFTDVKIAELVRHMNMAHGMRTAVP
jgi:hypothetical protein